jgi:hypothetical protein
MRVILYRKKCHGTLKARYGGWLNDSLNPHAIWHGGLGVGLLGTLGLLLPLETGAFCQLY